MIDNTKIIDQIDQFDPEQPTLELIVELYFNGLESEEDTNHYAMWINSITTFQTSGEGQCFFCLPPTLDAVVQTYFNGLKRQEDISQYIRWVEGIQLCQTSEIGNQSLFYYPYFSFISLRSNYDLDDKLTSNSSIAFLRHGCSSEEDKWRLLEENLLDLEEASDDH